MLHMYNMANLLALNVLLLPKDLTIIFQGIDSRNADPQSQQEYLKKNAKTDTKTDLATGKRKI